MNARARALPPPPVLSLPPVLPRCGEWGEAQEPRWRRPEQRQSATRRLAGPVDYHKGGEALGRGASRLLRGVRFGCFFLLAACLADLYARGRIHVLLRPSCGGVEAGSAW